MQKVAPNSEKQKHEQEVIRAAAIKAAEVAAAITRTRPQWDDLMVVADFGFPEPPPEATADGLRHIKPRAAACFMYLFHKSPGPVPVVAPSVHEINGTKVTMYALTRRYFVASLDREMLDAALGEHGKQIVASLKRRKGRVPVLATSGSSYLGVTIVPVDGIQMEAAS